MKTLVQINVSLNQGSTGRIVEEIGLLAKGTGWDSYMVHGARYMNPSKLHSIQVDSKNDEYLHYIKTLLFDKHGLGSTAATKQLVKKLKQINPNIVHLHNIHGYYINYKILFDYLIDNQIPTLWTMHDCWPFTGHCAYFDKIGCNKWIDQCCNCPQLKEFPKSILLDNSNNNYNLKKSLYEKMPNLLLVPVSKWLGDLASQSIIGRREIKVIHNGIDLSVFRPLDQLFLKKKYHLEDKFVILGVSNIFGERKGFVDFLRLAEKMSHCTIILIGLSEEENKQLLPNMIGIRYTESIEQMVEYYSMADVFANPTYEDNFPTTNIEALACGTPVITYNTGGSPEAVSEETGYVVKKSDLRDFVIKIIQVESRGKKSYLEACRKRAEKEFNHKIQYAKYLEIYDTLIGKK